MNESNPMYSDKRFVHLSQKFSKIKNLEIKSPNKLSNVEAKIDYLEMNLLKTIKEYDLKYKFLYEEIECLNKLIEDEKSNKIEFKNKTLQDIQNFENKIKLLFQTERENLKLFTENLIHTIELEILKINNEIENERELVNELMRSVKYYVDNEFPKLNQELDETLQNRNQNFKSVYEMVNEELEDKLNLQKKENEINQKIEEMMNNVKMEFETEREKRFTFEENIFKILEETFSKLNLELEIEN